MPSPQHATPDIVPTWTESFDGGHMKRREFLSYVGSIAVAWPLVPQAQSQERVRRIGVLMNPAADDPETQARSAALRQGLRQLGWTEGRNVRLDIRSGAADRGNAHKMAAEIVALSPDVIVATAVSSLTPLLRITRAIPIVFVVMPDPVGAGFVDSLAEPGGNVTGILLFEYSLSGKWLELLKEV